MPKNIARSPDTLMSVVNLIKRLLSAENSTEYDNFEMKEKRESVRRHINLLINYYYSDEYIPNVSGIKVELPGLVVKLRTLAKKARNDPEGLLPLLANIINDQLIPKIPSE
ncbi:MAG: hypothetical protein LBP75_01530 [Planctomycetota bacterium]|jgi:hypothetical protein|nr:hypothetical protein [Planctomycetota bacterium]